MAVTTASSTAAFPDNIVGSSAVFPPSLSLAAVEMLISDVTVTMEKRMKGVGESCWKRCCAGITIIFHGAAVPIRGALSAPGLLGLGKTYEVAMYLYLLYSSQRKMPENFHFAHLGKFTCCRIPFFESGPWAFTSSSGLWGLFWPVPVH